MSRRPSSLDQPALAGLLEDLETCEPAALSVPPDAPPWLLLQLAARHTAAELAAAGLSKATAAAARRQEELLAEAERLLSPLGVTRAGLERLVERSVRQARERALPLPLTGAPAPRSGPDAPEPADRADGKGARREEFAAAIEEARQAGRRAAREAGERLRRRGGAPEALDNWGTAVVVLEPGRDSPWVDLLETLAQRPLPRVRVTPGSGGSFTLQIEEMVQESAATLHEAAAEAALRVIEERLNIEGRVRTVD